MQHSLLQWLLPVNIFGDGGGFCRDSCITHGVAISPLESVLVLKNAAGT